MVSVIIPNYNHGQFLKQRVDSVLNQTFFDFEVIILDDCSQDDSKMIIENYRAHPKVKKIIYNKKNSGSTFSQWNKGVMHAKADYIWIAESDDFAEPDFLSRVLEPLLADAEVAISYCQSLRLNEKGEVNGTWKDYTDDLDPLLFCKDFIMDGRNYVERFLIRRNTVPNASAVIFRKDIFTKSGGALSHLKTNSDWFCWLKALCYGKIGYTAEPLNSFRYHNNSVIARTQLNSGIGGYVEHFNSGMRMEFVNFLSRKNIYLSKEINFFNRNSIALDMGNEGLYYLHNRKYLKGWIRILKATFFGKLNLRFIKRAKNGNYSAIQNLEF